MKCGSGKSAEQLIASAAQPIRGATGDYDGLMRLIGDARFVLLGEATHGTHEFYAERARISQRLITEKGFRALAVEADWPDAWRVNRYVRGDTDTDGGAPDLTAAQALDGFQRFPAWMWRNGDVVQLVEWLRSYNSGRARSDRAGFYGLDLYSLYTSISEVLRYLDRVDPAAAGEARKRYGCFDHYDQDSQAYGYAASFGASDSCQKAVVAQLQQLLQRGADYMRGGGSAEDAYFYARQNARLVINAEAYYRTMFEGRVASWNLRDRHMAETLDALAAHLSDSGEEAKIVVWAHNSHLGDARATQSQRLGEWNLGQLARERYGDAVRLIGFSTYHGWVTAASRWDGPAERKRVLPALPGSYEALLHKSLPGNYLLPLTAPYTAAGAPAAGAPAAGARSTIATQDQAALSRALADPMLERAIGVLYLPATERQSHYFHASLPRQFDAVIHIDTTAAVAPLEVMGRSGAEVPETYPEGI